MSGLEQFFWGFFGSVAAEIAALIQSYESGTVRFPEQYKRTTFWVACLLLALVASGFAVAYDIQKPVLAIHVGIATPLIIRALSQKRPENSI